MDNNVERNVGVLRRELLGYDRPPIAEGCRFVGKRLRTSKSIVGGILLDLQEELARGGKRNRKIAEKILLAENTYISLDLACEALGQVEAFLRVAPVEEFLG